MSSREVAADRGTQGARPGSARIWISLAVVLIAAGVLWRVSGSRQESIEQPAGEAVRAAPPAPALASAPADARALAGRWVRADHPYVLEIVVPTETEVPEAAYFNPQPINVSHVELREAEGAVGVFVELRDENYPGSTYTLTYDPADDVLRGVYFQAVHRQSFDVTFVRSPG